VCCLQGYNEFSLLSLSCSDYLSLPSVGIQIKNRLKDENVALSLPSQVGVLVEGGGQPRRVLQAAAEAAARQLMACPWNETAWMAQLAPADLPALQLPPHGCFCNLPQRVDRFDDDIAHIVTNSAKRSGLTFAPEAGTQVGLSSAALGCRLDWSHSLR
jgi:hypothetical protein